VKVAEAHVESADVGKLHIEQDDCRAVGFDQLQCLGTGCRVDDREPAALQVARLDVTLGVLVVDIEDCCSCHGLHGAAC